MIRLQEIDNAYERMQRSDVKYRFVIDNVTLGAPPRPRPASDLAQAQRSLQARLPLQSARPLPADPDREIAPEPTPCSGERLG